MPLCDCHGHVDPGGDEALVVDRVGRAAEGLAHEAVGRHRLDDDQLRELLSAGVERGEVRGDADLDAACDVILGAFLFHYLADGRPDADWPQRIADTIWPGLRALD